MLFTFKLEKPDNIKLTLERLKAKLAATGGKLSGNEKEGTISAGGAEGKYIVEDHAIRIVVTKKPLAIIPNRLIEKEIRDIFREISK